jgi:hypothetical protein
LSLDSTCCSWRSQFHAGSERDSSEPLKYFFTLSDKSFLSLASGITTFETLTKDIQNNKKLTTNIWKMKWISVLFVCVCVWFTVCIWDHYWLERDRRWCQCCLLWDFEWRRDFWFLRNEKWTLLFKLSFLFLVFLFFLFLAFLLFTSKNNQFLTCVFQWMPKIENEWLWQYPSVWGRDFKVSIRITRKIRNQKNKNDTKKSN